MNSERIEALLERIAGVRVRFLQADSAIVTLSGGMCVAGHGRLAISMREPPQGQWRRVSPLYGL